MSLNVPCFRIAVLPGDGIGTEIMAACTQVLSVLTEGNAGFTLDLAFLEAGADYFVRTGEDISQEAFNTARTADAILLGAMGLPQVRLPDGTEVAPHLAMRTEFGLFAGVRPVKQYPNLPPVLFDSRGKKVDLVIIRESTEGLFAHRSEGRVIDDRVALDTLEITRPVCERLFDFSFNLARDRKSRGLPGTVTCVDKANVFRSMAFFRKIFDERARLFPDISVRYQYVDAMALDLVRQPWEYDVLVMENMFGDILSDLGAGVVGGMGMAPCGEIGLEHGLFQPAHGSAPDIAGSGRANPTAMLVSAAMMLHWLGQRHANAHCQLAGERLDAAVTAGYAEGDFLPYEFGGTSGTMEIADRLCRRLAINGESV